jgi:hypothetical protein
LLSWRELQAVDLEQRVEDGGQINQAAPHLDVRGFDFGAAAIFDVQIILPRVAFDDGFGAFNFRLNGGLASCALSRTGQFFNCYGKTC